MSESTRDHFQSSNAKARPGESGASTRRHFVQTVGLTGVGLTVAPQTLVAQVTTPPRQNALIPRRPFGRTGEQVSIMGLGGHALGQVKLDDEAVRIVHEALDAGMNFMDNAWEYHDGRSEELMGRALAGRRDRAFLMTKVCSHGRSESVAMQQLEESLRCLKTDHLDLWQIHEVVYDDDPERHFAPDGAIHALDKAKQQGKTRFVGFTGHKDPAIHLKMLSYDYPFDACQLPVNPFDYHYRSFQREVMPELNRRQIAAIGMKSLGGTADMVKKKAISVQDALRYALSLPIATLVSGINSIGVLHQNLAVVQGFEPMSESEMAGVREQCRSQATDGRFELYKSSKRFDGAPGREQHGFPPPAEMPD